MTQRDRDRLIALKKAKKGLITQRQAAEEIGQTERHVRRLLAKLKREGDRAIIHGRRGRRSNRKLDEKSQAQAVAILGQEKYRGFGPTLASEYLSKCHQITVSRETVRAWMIEARLWRSRKQKVMKIHPWRQRRSRSGELVQWDTSEHQWLEERGPKLYLISMIDDATSRLHARFVLHDSTAENMRLLWSYLERNGRPVSFYTDKASLFQTAPKIARDIKELPRDERAPLPPTQIGRALSEMGIVWIAAHSPQAKGRVERSFQTAQVDGRAFPRSLRGSERMFGAPQSNAASQEAQQAGLRSATEESVDEELSLHSSRQSGSFRYSGETHWVGRAEAARPSSRFLYSKPPLGSFTKVSWARKAKPSEGTPQGPVDRGLAAVYFGANSVASALNLPRERDLPKNHPHFKPNLSTLPSKPDISTLPRLGHFYFALTSVETELTITLEMHSLFG